MSLSSDHGWARSGAGAVPALPDSRDAPAPSAGPASYPWCRVHHACHELRGAQAPSGSMRRRESGMNLGPRAPGSGWRWVERHPVGKRYAGNHARLGLAVGLSSAAGAKPLPCRLASIRSGNRDFEQDRQCSSASVGKGKCAAIASDDEMMGPVLRKRRGIAPNGCGTGCPDFAGGAASALCCHCAHAWLIHPPPGQQVRQDQR